MKFEEEFDDIFKRKTEEAKFGFRESDWEKARKMIDQERMAAFNSASRINYWYVSAFVLVSSIALIYFSLPESPQVAQADEVVYSLETKSTAVAVSATNKPESGIPSIEITTKASGRSEVVSSAGRSAKAGGVVKQSRKAKVQSKQGLQTNENTLPPEHLLSGIPNTEVQAPVKTLSDAERNETSVESKIDITDLSLNRKENTLKLFDLEKELQLQPVFLKRYEEEEYVPKQKFNRHVLDITLGLNYFAGWDNNGSVTAKGLNGYAGFNYAYFLTKKLSVGLGAELYNLSNINQQFYSSTSKNYGFGSTQTQTILTCQSMLFLSFPLRVYYAADEHHLIGLGLHAGTLLMASNTVETSELSDGLKQNVNTTSSKGVYQGMNTNNILLSASLCKTIGDRIGLQLELYYGLSDLFANTPSNGYQQNANGVRVGMNYRIFRN
jgi:hypothetical protein